MKARIVRYGFIGVVAVLIILCGMKFSNIYKDYQKLQFNQEQIDGSRADGEPESSKHQRRNSKSPPGLLQNSHSGSFRYPCCTSQSMQMQTIFSRPAIRGTLFSAR